MSEIRPIPDFEDYGATEDGRIYTRKHGREWRPMALHSKGEAAGGYLKVKLYKLGLCYQVAVHILVARTFIGERPTTDHIVDHEDHNKLNNHVSNLRWITASANTRWAIICKRFTPPIPRAEA